MNAAALAAALGKAHREGREWFCLCPAHDDHDPSLSLRDERGKVLVNCRAGCEQHAVIDALKARGLWQANGKDPRPNALNITAQYDYVDAAGQRRYQVVRIEPGKGGRSKDFLQRRLVGADWVWNLNGIDRIPYHLDEVARARAAATAGTPWRVWIPEGEKCVDRMREAWSVTATTNPGGAGKWRAEYNQHFPGADAVILLDNDKPGRDHARNVATQLHNVAAEVTIVEIPGLGPKQDVFDWIGQGHTLAELEELVTAAKSAPPKSAEPGERQWIRYKGGSLAALFTNAVTLLHSSPEWQGVVAFDEFANTVRLCGTPPWSSIRLDQPWSELFNMMATDWIQQRGLGVSRAIVADAVWTVAHDRAFHPVRDYLESCRWDGTPRLDGWATTYLGVEATWRTGPNGPIPDYVEVVAARWMISAVARVMRPGCKADCALILEGPQDRRKSTALRTLADPWFTDDFAEFGTKDAAIGTAGVWIIELAELDSINRAGTAKIKSFMSRQVDRYRPPYGTLLTEQRRQCVFAGTVNHSEYLKDETGGRRFWPLVCGTIDIDLLARDRDQLWAEARDRFLAGERWFLSDQDSPNLLAAARAEQQQRYQADAWDDVITAYLTRNLVTDISVGEALRDIIGFETQADWKQPDQNRVARCLRSLGWIQRRPGTGQNRERRYYKPEDDEAASADDSPSSTVNSDEPSAPPSPTGNGKWKLTK
jgi:predicted P-loop ATPase